LKFSKRCHAGPLRPIWAIMVAAKLDQSRVLVTKFRQNRSTLKRRSAGQRHAGWFLQPDCAPGPNDPSSECAPNVVPISEFRTCPDPEFPNVLHSEFMNTPNVDFLNVSLCSMPISYLAGSKWGHPLCYGHAAARWCWQRAHGACGGSIALDGVLRPHLRYGDRGRLQNVSPLSVLFESIGIFLQYTGDTDAKNDGPEF